MSEKKIVKSLCRMCDDHCGIDCWMEDGKVVKIEGNKELCGTGAALYQGQPWN